MSDGGPRFLAQILEQELGEDEIRQAWEEFRSIEIDAAIYALWAQGDVRFEWRSGQLLLCLVKDGAP